MVSSWYVAGRGAPTAQLAAARAAHRRRGQAVPRRRAGVPRRRGEPGRPLGAHRRRQEPRRHPDRTGAGRFARHRRRRRPASSSSASTTAWSASASAPRATSATRTCRPASPGCSRSSGRSTSWPARPSVYIAVLASGTATDFSEWVSAGASATRYQDEFTNTATPAELQAYRSVFGAAERPPAALPAAFPPTTQPPAVYYQQYQQQAAELDRAIGSVQNVVARRGQRQLGRRPARHARLRRGRRLRDAPHAAPHLVRVRVPSSARCAGSPRPAREMSQHQLPALVESLAHRRRRQRHPADAASRSRRRTRSASSPRRSTTSKR